MSKIKDIKPQGVPFKIGDKTFHLKFDMNSFAELEGVYGSIDAAMDEGQKGSIKALRAILWAGIIHEYLDENGNPTLRPHDLGAMIDMKNLKEVSGQLSAVLKEALPESELSDVDVPVEETKSPLV